MQIFFFRLTAVMIPRCCNGTGEGWGDEQIAIHRFRWKNRLPSLYFRGVFQGGQQQLKALFSTLYQCLSPVPFKKCSKIPPTQTKSASSKAFLSLIAEKKIDVKPPPHSTLKTSCTVRDCSEKNLKKKSATKYQFDPAEVTGGTGVCYEGSFWGRRGGLSHVLVSFLFFFFYFASKNKSRTAIT